MLIDLTGFWYESGPTAFGHCVPYRQIQAIEAADSLMELPLAEVVRRVLILNRASTCRTVTRRANPLRGVHPAGRLLGSHEHQRHRSARKIIEIESCSIHYGCVLHLLSLLSR